MGFWFLMVIFEGWKVFLMVVVGELLVLVVCVDFLVVYAFFSVECWEWGFYFWILLVFLRLREILLGIIGVVILLMKWLFLGILGFVFYIAALCVLLGLLFEGRCLGLLFGFLVLFRFAVKNFKSLFLVLGGLFCTKIGWLFRSLKLWRVKIIWGVFI